MPRPRLLSDGYVSVATFTDLPSAASDNVNMIRLVRDTSYVYFCTGSVWLDLTALGGVVTSVAGKTGTVALNTADVSESSNLYYTDARAQSANSSALATKEPLISAGTSSQYFRGDKTFQTLNTAAVSELTNLYYTPARFNSAFASKTTADLSEGSNLYYTSARSNTDFDTRLATKTTTNLTEGSNLYYTTARSNSAFDTRLALKTTTDLTEGSNLYYTASRFNSAFSAKSTTDLSEGTNLYYTNPRFNTAFAAKSTTDLPEGTNLYFTNARVTAAISATTYTPSTPARSLNSTFLISASKAAIVMYTIEITCILSILAGQTGKVELRSDTSSPPTTVRCAVTNANSGIIGLTNTQQSVLYYLVPAGHNVRLVSSGSAASITIVNQTEIVIG